MKGKTLLTAIVGVIAGLGLTMGAIAFAQDRGHMGSTQNTGMMGQSNQNTMHGQPTHGSTNTMHGQTLAKNDHHGKIQRSDTCHGNDTVGKTGKAGKADKKGKAGKVRKGGKA